MSCLNCNNCIITNDDYLGEQLGYELKCTQGLETDIKDIHKVENCKQAQYASNKIGSKLGLSKLIDLLIDEYCSFYIYLSDYQYNATDKLIKIFEIYEHLLEEARCDNTRGLSDKCKKCFKLQECNNEWVCIVKSKPSSCGKLYEEIDVRSLPPHEPISECEKLKQDRAAMKLIQYMKEKNRL